MEGALHGVRVLDFSHVLSAPYGTMLLGDMGADIIRIEALSGDNLRETPPKKNGLSAYFCCANRNKRALAVDLKKAAAKQLMYRMVKDCDVLVENFRPGVMERLDLGYERIKEIKPDIIYASLSAFGDIGPYRDKPGFELIVQSLVGLVSVTSDPKGRPAKVQPQLVDICGGMFLAIGILGALFHRQKTGRGQLVKTSLMEGLFALMTNLIYMNLFGAKVPYGLGTRNPMMFPSQAFKAKDGFFSTVVVPDHWGRLCRALGKPEWIDHPDYSDPVYRVQHYDEMEAMLEAVTATNTTAEWLETFGKHDVACGRINTVEEMFEDPQIKALNLLRTLIHPKAGEVKVQVAPWQMSETPPQVRLPPPILGEHTDEILTEFGYSAEEIQALKAGCVVAGDPCQGGGSRGTP
jgi:crotonobetainyl-CoA:carnitine CoA-transferase CaiB-like acyl-CoA transferase